MKIGRYVFALGMRDVSDCLGMLRQLDIYTARDGRETISNQWKGQGQDGV